MDGNNWRPAQGEFNSNMNHNMNPTMNPNSMNPSTANPGSMNTNMNPNNINPSNIANSMNPNMNSNITPNNVNPGNLNPNNLNPNMNPNMNANMDAGDWRTQLSPDSRQIIVNKIMDTLKKHVPIYGPDGIVELKQIAVRFEEKIYTAATSQTDYLRRISLKMLTMENKSQPASVGSNSLASGATGGTQTPQDPGSHGMQGQMRNQTQQHVNIPLGNQSQSRQQMMQQTLQNTIPSATVQNSTSLPPSVAPMTGVAQTSISNVGQSSNLPPNMSSISQNSVNNGIVGPGVSSSMFTNSQRQQLQGRQQALSQQPVHNVQQQFNMYQQQIMKQRVQQQVQPSLLQSQLQQQQSLLQSNQMQGSQQSLMQMSSGLPTNQTSLQQTQSSMMQSNAQSGLQQNPPIQQSPAVLQQHSQSVMRQQQQSQQSSVHQQQTSLVQQQLMSSQQQQLGQQPSGSTMQQNQLHTQQQQNNFSEMQQQRLLGQNQQQQQQLIAQHGNITNLHQQMSSQNNVANIQQHQHPMRLQQAKVAALQHQQQNQHTSSTLLPSQGQQTQMQPPQQQLMSHLPSQSTQLPQQLGLQQQQQQELQQSNALQRDMQQRIQTSSASLQPLSTVDQQRQQLFQSQRGLSEAPSSSMDSTAQTGHNGTDWQEEIYQKIKSLKDMHYLDLLEIYNRISQKLQQADSLQGPRPGDQMEKLRYFKAMVEKMLQFLSIQKSNIQPAFKEKMAIYEKQILHFLNTHRLKKPSTQQQPGGQSGGQSQTSISQQSAPQISQLQQHDNHMNQMQPINLQGSVTSGMQHGGTVSSSTHLGVSQTQQNMMNSLQTPPNMDLVPGSTLPHAVLGSAPQTTVNVSQQSNLCTYPQGGGVNILQPNMNALQPNANLLQQQHLKPQQDQQQLAQAQLMKQQFQQRHMLPLMQQQQKQQMMLQQQQQQLHQQQKQQTSQIHQMNNDVNDLKVRQGAGMIKPGMFGQHPQGPRPAYPHQQVKPGAPFPISSPQLLQSPSPQISQHPSPQIDQQLLNSLPKTGTPLQTAGSPFIVPSPSTPLSAPSPIPCEMEKPQTSAVSVITSAGNIGSQQMVSSTTQSQSLAIGTPGISASPLLAEFSSADANHSTAVSALPGKPNIAERPLDGLLKVVRSMSPKAFRSSVSDILSVVSMVDRIAGSAPGNGSRAAVGEDLVAMTKCRLQARNFIPPDGNGGATKKMRRHTSAMPLNAASSAGSVNNESLWQLSSLETSELESTATSKIKRQKVEANHALLDEIRDINLRLIDTVVEISDEDMDPTSAAAEGEGTVVRCSFSAVALSPTLKSHLVSAQMSPVLPLRLLVPVNYPKCSPVLLDKLPDEPGKEMEDLSSKAKSRFSICLRGLSQPMSLAEMARTWDGCARKVISEYAQQNGGGSFSSSYGTWESCVSA